MRCSCPATAKEMMARKERTKKMVRITTTNVILILYLQFTSKTAESTLYPLPGSFVCVCVCSMCRKEIFFCVRYEHWVASQSIDTHADGLKYSMWIFESYSLCQPSIHYHDCMQIRFLHSAACKHKENQIIKKNKIEEEKKW